MTTGRINQIYRYIIIIKNTDRYFQRLHFLICPLIIINVFLNYNRRATYFNNEFKQLNYIFEY